MKHLLLILMLAVGSWGASIVQTIGNAVLGSGSASVSFSNVTNGNRITIQLAVTASYDIDISNISKTAGTATIGTITLDKQLTWWCCDIVIASVVVTGSGSLTLSTTTLNDPTLSMAEISGVDISESYIVNSDYRQSSGSTMSTNSITSGSDGGVYVGLISTCYAAGPTAFSAGTGYTDIFNNTTQLMVSSVYKIVTTQTTATINWTAGTSFDWITVGVVYKMGSAPVSNCYLLRKGAVNGRIYKQ